MSVERLSPAVRELVRAEIAAAHGREVSFVARPDANGRIVEARPVARGTVDAVLALPGIAHRGELLLHNHPSGVLEPSGADLSVAARLHDGGVGFAIVDNEVSDCYVVVECPRPRATTRLDPFDVAGLLAPQGPVARALGGYEDRPSQRDMAAYIADAYNDGGVALLEAGTGVGKSFAYLAPALVWARENGERTIVSTNTINLQEQLVGKDLPILARALGTGEHSPSFALLKGWRNYLCLARLEQARDARGSLFEDERAAELEALAAWAVQTSDGSLSDLPDEPAAEVWDAVAAESDLCTRLKCPHFDQCFLFQARRRAAEADVVVVNHHLLASDLAVRMVSDNWQEAAVLPPYRRLVLDEAHHLEDVAAMHLGAQVSMLGVQRLLSRLEKNGRGLLPTLGAVLAGRDDLLSAASRDLVHQSLFDALGAARRAADALFTLLARRLDSEPGPTPVLRLTDDFVRDDVWAQGLDVTLDNLLLGFSRLRDGVAVVLTSATLAAGGDFGFLEQRVGLDLPPSRVRAREIHASPFDFPAQCLFGIPTDLPEPRDDEQGHDAAVARVLVELAHASDGGMFVLFTSHGALRRAAEAVRGVIGGRWPLLVQGEGQRDQLLRRFREAGSAILLGTDSFWEGVDVPGRALRVLILAKLPFKVPSEPLTAARLERLEARGLNGFTHYLVPHAALKLKQGFGRLIRRTTDVGAVVLLDRRVVTKRYGRLILEGLPPAARAVGSWQDVRRACEEFFAGHGIEAALGAKG